MSINDEIDFGKLDSTDNRGIETISRNIYGNYGMYRRTGIEALAAVCESSFSTLVVKMVLDLSKNDYGAETYLIDLRKKNIPIYNPDDSSHNNLQRMGQRLRRTDSFVLASPDYHGSMSGVMKNFLQTKIICTNHIFLSAIVWSYGGCVLSCVTVHFIYTLFS